MSKLMCQWNKAKKGVYARLISARQYIMTVLVLSLMSGATFAQSDTLELDAGQFLSAINQWLPLAMSIIAIGVGIAGAFALARFVGSLILNAFNGRI